MKILVVEDNPADVEILREFLDPQGSLFEMENVKNLASAKVALLRGETEFILLDLGLPDSQGIATLREVRSCYPTHPIVVLTGFDDEETAMLALHEGAQDYLVKGKISRASLVRSIRYSYERNKIEEELVRKNTDLDAMNEELTATGEELRQAQTALEYRVRERTLELNEAVDALKTERQRLYDVLETLPVYVCLLTEDYHILFANRYFRETFGEPKGRCCYDFLFNRQKPCETCETYTVMKTRAPHHWYWTGPNGRGYDIYDYPFIGSDTSFNILVMGIDITERKRAEAELQKAHDLLEVRVRARTEELRQKNEKLNALNEELSATQEELYQNVDELSKREQDLKQSETHLKETLAEKEILLSEIHHRVKNNLTAFISLLSLEGTYEETSAGQAFKKDLQNRARTMALIHETLYKTRQYSNVDMEVYLSTLVEQVVNSYSSTQSIRTVVDAKGVTLDLNRATPIGLIINELVTNALKYAFPRDRITCLADRKVPCTIGIRLTKENGTYLLKVSDNGVGLPQGLDIKTTKSLGLKLVNFLASHQLRAKLDIKTDNGTEFAFRFDERGRNK